MAARRNLGCAEGSLGFESGPDCGSYPAKINISVWHAGEMSWCASQGGADLKGCSGMPSNVGSCYSTSIFHLPLLLSSVCDSPLPPPPPFSLVSRRRTEWMWGTVNPLVIRDPLQTNYDDHRSGTSDSKQPGWVWGRSTTETWRQASRRYIYSLYSMWILAFYFRCVLCLGGRKPDSTQKPKTNGFPHCFFHRIPQSFYSPPLSLLVFVRLAHLNRRLIFLLIVTVIIYPIIRLSDTEVSNVVAMQTIIWAKDTPLQHWRPDLYSDACKSCEPRGGGGAL